MKTPQVPPIPGTSPLGLPVPANRHFIRRLGDGSTYRLGTAAYSPGYGWKFISNIASHKNSRKFHATWEKCLPRWVGYPDSCESWEVGQAPRPGTTEASDQTMQTLRDHTGGH